jgi:hypothetical protein
MNIAVDIQISDTVKTLVERARQILNPLTMHKGVAAEAAKVTRENFRKLDSARANKMGGDRTHFYGRYREGTRPEADANSARVVIADPWSSGAGKSPLLAHYFGGTIRPSKRKFLAIPARAEYYGRRPTEFQNLKFAVLPNGGPVLLTVAASTFTYRKDTRKGWDGQLRSRKLGTEEGGMVAYWLRKSVKLKADTSVLPTTETLSLAAVRSITRQLQHLRGTGGQLS